jgi:proton glutamate symport protein
MKLKLHWQIIIGLVTGTLFGIFAAWNHWSGFTQDWIAPFGTIFVNLLKLIAVPLVFASLVTGIASLADISQLSRMGGKTIGIYLATTAVAITIGLLLVNALKPGSMMPKEVGIELQEAYQSNVEDQSASVEIVKERGPLQPMVDIVPTNIVAAASDNRKMLQVVFFSLLFGIGLMSLNSDGAATVTRFVSGMNDVIIQIVDFIMMIAPVGVFALMAGTITAIAGDDLGTILQLLQALGFYSFVVVLGLFLHVFIVYGFMVRFFTPHSLKKFFTGIAPAQLVAFSTSSSAATLPVSFECVEENLGVKNEVASFVLPIGATINLDGTALYQGVAAVFIAQVLGIPLDFIAQLTIVLTALLASIGAAPVPGAGLIMLVIVLEAVGVPSAGLALILGVDRILDMVRTATNVTGDCAVTALIDASEKRAKENT